MNQASLAEALRNRGLYVSSGTPHGRVFAEEFVLEYEPRTLAVSPSGTRVVVGTKAGAVAAFEYTGDGWRRAPPRLDASAHEALWTKSDPSFRRAIRVLAFLDDSTFIAGGGSRILPFNWGADGPGAPLRILDVSGGELSTWQPRGVREILTERLQKEPWRDTHPSARAGRTLRSAPLWEDPPELDSVVWTPVHLLLTPRVEIRAVLARLKDGRPEYAVGRGPAVEFLGGGFGSEADGEEVIVQAFVVDGAWPSSSVSAHGLRPGVGVRPGGAGGVVYLVSSGGLVHRVAGAAAADTGRDIRKMVLERIGRMPRPAAGARVTNVSCRGPWIAVQYGAEHTVVHREEICPDPKVVPRSRWIQIPQAREFTLFRPPWLGSSDPTQRNPLWLIVSSARKGLAWTAWSPTESPKERWVPRTLAPSRAGPKWSLAGSGATDVLLVTTRPRTPLPAEAGNPPPYLLTATRDQRLRITSFVDMDGARRDLFSAPPVHTEAQDGGEAEGGVALWRAEQTMCRDFGFHPIELVPGPRPSSTDPLPRGWDQVWHPRPEIHRIPAFLRSLDEADLHRLAQLLHRFVGWADQELRSLSGVSRCPLEGAWDVELDRLRVPREHRRARGVILAVQLWSLRLLRRATELPERASEAKAELAERLARAAIQTRSPDLLQLHLMAEVWHKWILGGPTYREKGGSRIDHARWNLECGRNLDALFYAARLLRERLDVFASTRIPSNHPNATIKCLTEAPGGAFAVSSHHDGRVVATTVGGAPLRWVGRLPEGLEFADGKLALARARHGEFLRLHWHGPYARTLHVAALGDRYLVCVPTKGDDSPDGGGVPVQLHVLVVRVADGALQIESASTTRAPAEVYSVTPLLEAEDAVVLLWGLRGAADRAPEGLWLIEVDARANVTEPLRASVQGGGAASAASRNRGAEHRYEPIWVLTGQRCGDVPAWSVLTGREDGTIRGYRIREEAGRWTVEPASGGGPALPHRVVTGERVTALDVGWDGAGGARWIAYGTAKGRIGVIRRLDSQMRGAGDADGAWVHLVHSVERGWVTGHTR